MRCIKGGGLLNPAETCPCGTSPAYIPYRGGKQHFSRFTIGQAISPFLFIIISAVQIKIRINGFGKHAVIPDLKAICLKPVIVGQFGRNL
jgi:hypothetical protein